MPSLQTPGIVLRTVNFRERDRLLTVLSPQYGRMDVLSRGCRRPKSPLMPVSELFVCGDMMLFSASEHYTLTSCVLQDNFYPLRLDSYRLTCASYMAALCAEAAQPGQAADRLYSLLLKGLYYLAYEPDVDALSTTTAFLLLLADEMGYRPTFTKCIHCKQPVNLSASAWFDSLAGGFCCTDCASRSADAIEHDLIVWMSETLRNGNLPQKENSAGQLFDVLRRYVERRLDASIPVSRLLP